MLPVIIARYIVGKDKAFRLVIHFVDNDGVSDALIKGFSRTESLRRMLRKYIEQECESSLCSWIGRVPSPSNPADAPSRLLSYFSDGLDRGLDVSSKATEILEGLIPYMTRRDQG